MVEKETKKVEKYTSDTSKLNQKLDEIKLENQKKANQIINLESSLSKVKTELDAIRQENKRMGEKYRIKK